MPKCPKCGESINHLIFVDLAMSDFDGQNYQDIQYLDGEGTYECPECGEQLFDRGDNARAFFDA